MTLDLISISLRRFFVRDDAEYDAYQEKYQPRTGAAQVFYLFMYFFPGILAYALINRRPVFDWALRHTGLTGASTSTCCLSSGRSACISCFRS